MYKKYLKNIVSFILINSFFLVLHLFFQQNLESNLEQTTLNTTFSYSVNMLASLVIYLVVLLLIKRYEPQIGFIFLGLSALKMLLLFLLLNPTNQFGEVARADVFSFFIPFALNLILEVIFVVKLLKISDLTTALKKQ